MAKLSDDEYAAFDFPEFTEEDFREIDEQLARQVGPEVTIELDSPFVDVPNSPSERMWASESPLSQFRRDGVLSVTDLSALAWCEVQFDYGLRQRRSRPVASRPASFVSKQGKTINVEKTTAVKNDQIQSKGKAVHKQLENEIPMEEVQVTVSYPEERWALRLVNMMACVNCLLDYGITREMPIFGMVNGVMVNGIIDEVTRQIAKPKTTQATRKHSPRKKKPLSSSQARITEFLSGKDPISPEGLSENSHVYTHTLHLSDTKTRRTNSLPAHPDTLPSRIQVMLYRRLLNDLLSPSYDFTLLWSYLDLKPSRKLSDRFLESSGLGRVDRSIACLDDIGRLWVRIAAHLNVPGVDPMLKLVYRLQPKANPQRLPVSRVRPPDLSSIQEDIDLKSAIEASLRDISAQDAKNTPNEVENMISTLQNGEALANIGRVSSEEFSNPHTGQIIGTKKFLYKDDFLDLYLTRALEWWLGQRDPEGVSLDDSRRCFSCEYADDCEWRERKAVEFRHHILERRQLTRMPPTSHFWNKG